MDKVNWQDRQEMTLGDTTSGFDLVEQEFQRLVREFICEDPVVIAGFAVGAQSPAALAVDVKVDGDLGWSVGIDPQTGKPVRLMEDGEASFEAAHPSLPRIDVVAVRRDRELNDEEPRTFWDPSLEQTYEDSTYTRDLDSAEIVVIQGDASSSPVAPTEYGGQPITDNFLILAEVTIGAGATTVTGGDISDERTMYARPKLADGSIDTAQLAAGAVETAKLDDGVVTNGKVADFALGHDKLEGVRRGRFDLTASYQDLWSGDTKDWLDRYALVYLAHQPAATAVERTAMLDLAAADTDYTVGTLSTRTVYIKVAANGRLEVKLDSSTLPDVYIRIEDAGSNNA